MKRLSVTLGVLCFFASTTARADSGRLHLHGDFGVGGAVVGPAAHQSTSNDHSVGGVLGLSLDWQFRSPFALEALFQAGGFTKPFPTSNRTAASLFGLTFGGRFRFFDDRRGYMGERGGNPWGNFYVAAHAGFYSFDSTQFGLDFSAGYEFSIHRPISLGPMIRLMTLFGGANSGPDVVLIAGIGTSFEVVDPPSSDDADGDGLPDSEELRLGTNPHRADSDDDGLPDGLEADTDTDPKSFDTDGDGLSDGYEDANANGLLDRGETDPRNFDTDGGGISDGDEVITLHTNPRDRHDDDDDGDQVPNDADHCPNTPAGSTVDMAGCPIRGGAAAEVHAVGFVAGRTVLTPDGEATLRQVLGSLRTGRTVIRVFVHGSGDAASDARVAQRRADVIASFLADNGVPRERFSVESIGADTVEGRSADPNVATIVLDAR